MKAQRTLHFLLFTALLGCDEPGAGQKPTVENTASQSAAAAPTPAPTAEASEAPATEQTPEKPPETVAAQHILITYSGAKNAPKEVKRNKAAAKKLAEEVLAKARSDGDFTALVKEYSEDPGTKDRLGSVGKFTPDKMVKPFSDAAFALKVDAVSDVVETEFGFHVIKRNQ